MPRRHVETVFDLTRKEEVALMQRVAHTARAVRATFDPDGVVLLQRNGVAAEQTVPHVHFHVIPRREGTPFPSHEWVQNMPADIRALQAVKRQERWDEV